MLVPLTYGLSVRYAHRTGLLQQLSEVCHPVVGLGWGDAELSAVLRGEGLEVLQLPEPRMTHAHRNQARLMDLMHDRRLRSPTTRIRRDRWKRRGLDRRRLIAEARNLRDHLAVRRPGGAAAVESADDSVTRAETNLEQFEEVLRTNRIDAVLSFTPYHDQDELLLVAARDLGATTLVSIISFDNPTIRGRLVVAPDLVMVWNRYNADEVVRSHPRLDPAAVRVVGAPQFDLHRQPQLVMDEGTWRSRLGLPDERPIILYGAGPRRLIPGEDRLVEVLDRAISDDRIPGRPFLLVRRHPVDPSGPWDELATRLRNGVIVTPWGTGDAPKRNWPSTDELSMQMSSLAHSAVHVNVCSSMTVDGAMFDRPQVGPVFVPGASALQRRAVRNFYRQEHWAPIARSGGLVLADDEAELFEAVSRALAHPEERRGDRERLLQGVLTWPDGRSTARLVEQVGQALRC